MKNEEGISLVIEAFALRRHAKKLEESMAISNTLVLADKLVKKLAKKKHQHKIY
ncbi:MAG: hypothetical protein IJ599_00825 [Alphaproteobacteria bacterium]|nr:hypothetical protein [Alphaproteobacteria bacterium]